MPGRRYSELDHEETVVSNAGQLFQHCESLAGIQCRRHMEICCVSKQIGSLTLVRNSDQPGGPPALEQNGYRPHPPADHPPEEEQKEEEEDRSHFGSRSSFSSFCSSSGGRSLGG